MNKFENLSDSGNFSNIQKLHIANSKQKKKIECTLLAFTFKDKDTKQTVIYMPSFEFTGYGETVEKAKEMIKQVMDDYFGYLIDLSPKSLEVELKKYGWIQDKYKHKDYSKTYIDRDGDLQGFNAIEGEIKKELVSY